MKIDFSKKSCPTKKERDAAFEIIPKIPVFSFKSYEISDLLGKKVGSMINVNQSNHLYWWGYCYTNRRGHLLESFVNAFTYFQRGFPDEGFKLNEETAINKIEFDYYSEIYFYFYFALLENIYQILNCFYDLNIKEGNVSFKSIKDKININVNNVIEEFNSEIKDIKDIRNSFTHRFPKKLYG